MELPPRKLHSIHKAPRKLNYIHKKVSHLMHRKVRHLAHRVICTTYHQFLKQVCNLAHFILTFSLGVNSYSESLSLYYSSLSLLVSTTLLLVFSLQLGMRMKTHSIIKVRHLKGGSFTHYLALLCLGGWREGIKLLLATLE